MNIECYLCSHAWDYQGQSKKYVTCPSCMNKIKIPRDEGDKVW